jgi:diaminobutyrate-2-oxoglutarate transaminase
VSANEEDAAPAPADLRVFDTLESEVRSYVRSFPVVFDEARGSIMRDENGAEYIDFFSGAGSLNYGHNNPVFTKELISYLESGSIVHGLDFATAAKRTFIESFSTRILEPRRLDYKLQFPGPTGTNAVEAALKLARQVTGRSTVIAFSHGFHGVTSGSLAVTADAKFRQAAGAPLANAVFAPFDGYLGEGYHTIDYLDRLVNDPGSGIDLPAAVIVETVQGEGGVNVARPEWLIALSRLCERTGMLLIVDDIQVGCGRTGDFFSFEEAGIVPDIVTLSKSISGYGLPMSLLLMKREHDIWKPGAHSGTFRGNNLAFVAGTAALETYWKDDAFSRETVRKGAIVQSRLQGIAMENSSVRLSVRGRGLIQGLASTFVPTFARDVSRAAFSKGLIVETSGSLGEVLKLLPALTIDDETLQRGLDIIESSVAAVLRRSGEPVSA